jgi:hypothetical protein
MAEPIFRDISCRRDHDSLVITFNLAEIRGDEIGDDLRQQLHDAVDHFRCVKLVLDFANVRFLTSTAFLQPFPRARRSIPCHAPGQHEPLVGGAVRNGQGLAGSPCRTQQHLDAYVDVCEVRRAR